jgi:Ulp1 family protease
MNFGTSVPKKLCGFHNFLLAQNYNYNSKETFFTMETKKISFPITAIKVEDQKNMYDCGVHLLQFVERFLACMKSQQSALESDTNILLTQPFTDTKYYKPEAITHLRRQLCIIINSFRGDS